MRKIKTYKCPECGAKFKSLQTWGNHVTKTHPNLIPEDFSYARYYYYIVTSKLAGSCIECKRDTKWNEATEKYERFCPDPKCKAKYREAFKKRMIDKHGKVHLLDDPDKQREMIAAKKTSGKYKFRNGKEVSYASSYEKDFLRILDTVIKFDPNDIMGPSPHKYEYKDGDRMRFYIPDYYIPSLNLEIEIKDTTNKHPGRAATSGAKDILKDKVMRGLKDINYIKIINKEYKPFFDLIDKLKSEANVPIDEEYTAVLENSLSLSNSKIKFKDVKWYPLDEGTIALYKSKLNLLSTLKLSLANSGEIAILDNKPIGFYVTEKVGNVMWLSRVINVPIDEYSIWAEIVRRAIRKSKITNVRINAINDDRYYPILAKLGFFVYGRDNEYVLYWRPNT